jgi:hypothetical protein
MCSRKTATDEIQKEGLCENGSDLIDHFSHGGSIAQFHTHSCHRTVAAGRVFRLSFSDEIPCLFSPFSDEFLERVCH